jgi:ATPase family associated with various cellular activities (AAA)
MQLDSYFPKEPAAPVKPTDTVPGTKATWGDAIKNFLERSVEEADRAKQKKAEGYQGHPGLEEALRKLHPEAPEKLKVGEPFVTPSKPPEKPVPVPQKQFANPPRPERLPTPPKPPPQIERPPAPPVTPPQESPPSAPPASVVTNAPAEILAELDGLIGLDEVKAQVRKTVNLIGLGKEREKAGLPHLDLTHHLVFTGNPGTGKTTVARLVGRIYKEIGLLKSGHMIEADRGDLVGEYIGQTAPKTKEVIDRAMDGVLFIDEAYSLAPVNVPNDFGKEVISTLIKAMEYNRGWFVVIVAGYKEEMEHMIGINPGLKSRFKTFIDFQDYSPAELFKILAHMAGEGDQVFRRRYDCCVVVDGVARHRKKGLRQRPHCPEYLRGVPRPAGGTAGGIARQESRCDDLREGRYPEKRGGEFRLVDQVKRDAKGEQAAPGENARDGHAGGARHEPGDSPALSFPLQAPEESENAGGDEDHKDIPGRAAGFLEQGEDRCRGEENNDAGDQGFEERRPERLFPRGAQKMPVREQVAARALPS